MVAASQIIFTFELFIAWKIGLLWCGMQVIMGCLREISDTVKHHMAPVPYLKENMFAYEYQVINKIGEGSFSEVLQCIDKQSGVPVAAKILKKSFRNALHAEELPELIALRKLTRHKNILHMIETHFEKETGRVTLVFELMDMSLYDVIRTRKKPITETKAKNYLYQIVKGVDHIHHHGIFHRDIKPENILVKGEAVKIADLGSIKGIYSQQPYTEYISTRWYRSPECLLTSGFYGPKMDVWAIGCVFFELLTLKPLFPGSSEVDQIAKIHNVLGTPNCRLLMKFKKHKVRNFNVTFPTKQGTGLNPLIPFISDIGREVLKQMIVYDPESRINIRRLIEHKYFADLSDTYVTAVQDHILELSLKIADCLLKKFRALEDLFGGIPTRQSDLSSQKSSSWTSISSGKTSWRNPVFLSYLTSDKRRKTKMDENTNPTTTVTHETAANRMNHDLPGDWKDAGNSLQKLRENLSTYKNVPEKLPGESGENVRVLEKAKPNIFKRNHASLISGQTNVKKNLNILQNTKLNTNLKEGNSVNTLSKEYGIKKILRERLDKKYIESLNLKEEIRRGPPILGESSKNVVHKALPTNQQAISSKILATYRTLKKS